MRILPILLAVHLRLHRDGFDFQEGRGARREVRGREVLQDIGFVVTLVCSCTCSTLPTILACLRRTIRNRHNLLLGSRHLVHIIALVDDQGIPRDDLHVVGV